MYNCLKLLVFLNVNADTGVFQGCCDGQLHFSHTVYHLMVEPA